MFAKTLSGEPIKSRLRPELTPAQCEAFYVASLADTLETAARFEVRPVLFLSGGEHPDAVGELRVRLLELGVAPAVWTAFRQERQRGEDLGMRLEAAIQVLVDGREQGDSTSALIIGSDSPSLRVEMLREAARRLSDATTPIDVLLGPTLDGGYWTIGMRQPQPGLLRGIAWSTPQVLADTQQRAAGRGLRVGLAAMWSDVDVPADLDVLAKQIRALRAAGDRDTARHVERFLQQHGRMERR